MLLPWFYLTAAKIWSNRQTSVTALCDFLDSVLLQEKFEVTDGPVLQLCVTAQFYLASKGKYSLKAWRQVDPKDTKRRGAPTQFLASIFMCFFSLPPEPALCKLGYPGGLFTWGPYSSLQAFLCSIFTGFSLLFLLSTTMLSSLEKHLFRFSAHF